MITDRNSLQEYLQADRTALGMSGKRPSIFGQEVWKYERALRYVEYYQNVGGGVLENYTGNGSFISLA